MLAILIFSFVPVSIKFVGANPITIGIFRLIVTCFILVLWWRGKNLSHIFRSSEFYRLPLLGLVFFGHWMTYFYAIKIGGPSACVLGMCTYGIQLQFYGSIFLNFHLSLKNYIILGIVLIGISFTMPNFNASDNFTKGVILGITSASCYSILPIIHQRSNRYFSHEVRIFYQFFFCLICFLFFIPETNWHLKTNDWLGLIFLATFGTLIAHTLWTKVTSQLPTYITGIIYYIITPMSLLFSRLIFGEILSVKQILGAVLIISAAIYNIWSSHDQYIKA